MSGNGMAEVGQPEKTHPGGSQGVLAMLMTRCACQRTLEVPHPPPGTITIELAPVIGDETAVRIFYLAATGMSADGRRAAKYIEGPPKDKPRILIPGMGTPRGPLRAAA